MKKFEEIQPKFNIYCKDFDDPEQCGLSFIKIIHTRRTYDQNGHSKYVEKVFEEMFNENRIEDFSGDFFIRVVFFSSPSNKHLHNRPELRFRYSLENSTYFSDYEKSSIREIKEIIKIVLTNVGLINQRVNDEYDVIIGNPDKSNKINIDPLPLNGL